MRPPLLLLPALLVLLTLTPGARASFTGPWITADGGALLDLAAQGDEVVVRLLAVADPLLPDEATERARDLRNPDAALRTRPLAGLELGRLRRDGAGLGGRLYDPESGRMVSVAAAAPTSTMLRVHAWIGLRAFGRTLVWVRPARWRARAEALLAAAPEAAR